MISYLAGVIVGIVCMEYLIRMWMDDVTGPPYSRNNTLHVLHIATYPLRLLWYAIASPAPTCRKRWCARPIVGFSVWCRRHTDEILKGNR